MASSATRSISSTAADSAYSAVLEKKCDGAPLLVLPPCVRESLVPSALSTMPLGEWFSSERGRPRIRSTLVQLEPFQVSLDRMPELVSRLRSPKLAMRGSLEVT